MKDNDSEIKQKENPENKSKIGTQLHSINTINKNILLLGKIGAGKTTIANLIIKGSAFKPESRFFYSSSREVKLYSTYVQGNKNNYNIKIIDTSGLIEVRDKQKTIVEMSKIFIQKEVTSFDIMYVITLPILNEEITQLCEIIASFKNLSQVKTEMLYLVINRCDFAFILKMNKKANIKDIEELSGLKKLGEVLKPIELLYVEGLWPEFGRVSTYQEESERARHGLLNLITRGDYQNIETSSIATVEQQAEIIESKIISLLRSNKNYYKFSKDQKSQQSLYTFVLTACQKHPRWNEFNENFTSIANREANKIINEGISKGILAWQALYRPQDLLQTVVEDTMPDSSAELKIKSSKQEDEEPTTNLSSEQELPQQAKTDPSENFPAEELEVLLDWVQQANIKRILEDARKNKKSAFMKTLTYFKDLGNDESAITRFIQTVSTKEIWLVAKHLNWYRTPGVIYQKTLDSLGFSRTVDWMNALGTELKVAVNAVQQIQIFFNAFQNNDGTPNYDKLALVLLQDAALHDVLERHQTEIVELCVVAGIPGFDDKTAARAIHLLLDIQVKTIGLEKKFDSIITLGIQLCHDETAQLADWIKQVGLLIENLYLVIQVYTEPKSASMADIIQADVKTIFSYARQQLVIPNNPNLAAVIDGPASRMVDCKWLFSEYLDSRLGPLISRGLTTNKADVIRAGDLRGIHFVGSSKENLYKFDKFILKGFNFSDCYFQFCSLRQTSIDKCNFENAQFHGVLDITDMHIDASSAKSFCDALAKSLEQNNLIIIGKMCLSGDFKGISLSISSDYYVAAGAQNFDLTIQNSAQTVPVSEKSDQLSSNIKDEKQEEKDEQQIGYMQSFYEYLQPYIASTSSTTMDYVGKSISFVKDVAVNGMVAAKERTKQFVTGSEAQEEQLILFIEKELQDKINALQDQLKKESQQEIDTVKIQVGGLANLQTVEHEALQKKINDLEKALHPIASYWEKKEKINQDRELLRHGKGEAVEAYYLTLLTKLCAAFHALLILQSDFIEHKEGALKNVKSKLGGIASTTANAAIAATKTSSLVLENLDTIASGVGKAASFLGSAGLQLFSSKLVTLGDSIPFLGVATTAGKMAADFAINTLDKRALATANRNLLGFTPELLTDLAEELARELTFIYQTQIDLLIPKSAARFAECSLGRILAGLLNDKIHGKCFVADAIAVVQTYEVKQSQIKFEAIQMTFGIPLRHEHLKTKLGTKITEDKLHRKTGVYLEVQNEFLYFSNDKEKSNYNAKAPKTYATEAGYIKTNKMPTHMTPDDSKRGPKIQNESISKLTQTKSPQNSSETSRVDTMPVKKIKVGENSVEIVQLQNENILLKENITNITDELQQLKSLFVKALANVPERGYSSQTLTQEGHFLKGLYDASLRIQQEDKTKLQKKTKKNSTEADVKILPNIQSQNGFCFKRIELAYKQLGWNCGDVALGINRRKWVAELIANADEEELRNLLVPEILTAAMLRVANECGKEEENAEKQKRLLELYEIQFALSGTDEEIMIQKQIWQTLITGAQETAIEAYTLPKEIYNEEVKLLILNYQQAHDDMKEILVLCNVKLGSKEGNYLSLQRLEEFFDDENNQQQHAETYQHFQKAWLTIFLPQRKALYDFCSKKETFINYIRHYYGNNQWLVYHPQSGGKNNTSIFDAIAWLYGWQIFLYRKEMNKATGKLDYVSDHTTKNYCDNNQTENKKHVLFNGVNHFIRLELTAKIESKTEILPSQLEETQPKKLEEKLSGKKKEDSKKPNRKTSMQQKSLNPSLPQTFLPPPKPSQSSKSDAEKSAKVEERNSKSNQGFK